MNLEIIKNKTKLTARAEIKEIFALYEAVYGIDFKINICTPIPEGLVIQNRSVTHLVKKEKTNIYKITLSNGEVMYPSENHPFMIGHKTYSKKVHLKDVEMGALLFDGIYLKDKELFDYDYVYDFTVNTKAHTYMKGGIKHHNSLDEIPLNHQFSTIGFDVPSKEDFMAYIGSRFAGAEGEEETSVVKPNVYNKFLEVLEDNDMGHKDSETGIRVSPRRWEEIIKYVSNGIPPKDQKAAEALVHFVYTNMRDYKEKTQSSMTIKYAEMVKGLIKESSDFNVDGVTQPRADEWENLFENQIRSKMELGSDRKYVASLAGLPGVGKTSKMRSLAKKMGMKLIEIDCSTLNSEDVVGLTTPSKGEDQILRTKFTAPPLWSKIMDQYDSSIKIPGSNYTHILFLDEITRSGCWDADQVIDIQSKDKKFLSIFDMND